MLQITTYTKNGDRLKLLARPVFEKGKLNGKVRSILNDVKKNRDKALRKYSFELDGFGGSLAVTEREIAAAGKRVSPELRKAIRVAARNIGKFHRSQKDPEEVIETMPGVRCWRSSRGIEKVGLYIPGGSAPLFSTVLMLGIPAGIAGCGEVVLCTPPGKDGSVEPAILFAAKLCGIKKIFRVGGAQAIAAMAYGTETIPAVYKIFGPGNQYVTCAKELVNADGIAIDMPAGPSELAVMADSSADPAFVAADLLSQAEHGPDSQVILVTDDKRLAAAVNIELKEQIGLLPRLAIAKAALKNSKAILVTDMRQGIDLLNDYAPEHLIIACRNRSRIASMVRNAGSVFLGNYTCESAGDYASGTNHTLPTNGFAKVHGGVSLDSFVRKITFQEVSAKGIRRIGNTIEVMAEAEGLRAHKNAVSIRLKQLKNKK